MKTYTLPINGIEYACAEAGEGPLVLFMHGTFGGKQLLYPQVECLSRFCRCVAFDWPGHGDSGYKAGGWTVNDLISAVPAIIEALGEKSAFLCGVSQGGAVSMRVAIAYPDKVRGLVNMCAGPGGPPSQAATPLDNFAAVLAEEPDETKRRKATEEFVTRIFHDPGFAARAPHRAEMEIKLILGHPRESAKFLPGVPKSYVLLTSEQLASISCPTLIIWAEYENRPGLGAELASLIPDCALVIIKDAGHHVNLDQPEATSRAIEEFVRRHI